MLEQSFLRNSSLLLLVLLMKNIPFSVPQLLPQVAVEGESVVGIFGLVVGFVVVFVVVIDVGFEYEIKVSDEWNNVVVKVDSVKDLYREVNVFDGAEDRTSERRSSEAFLFVELTLDDSVETCILVDTFDKYVGFKSETTDTCLCDEVNLCDNVEVWMLGRGSPDRILVGPMLGGKCEAIDLAVVVDADLCFCHEFDVCDVTEEQLFERGPIDEFLSIGHVFTGGVEVVVLKESLGVVVA